LVIAIWLVLDKNGNVNCNSNRVSELLQFDVTILNQNLNSFTQSFVICDN
jgi:hypothetical protein